MAIIWPQDNKEIKLELWERLKQLKIVYFNIYSVTHITLRVCSKSFKEYDQLHMYYGLFFQIKKKCTFIPRTNCKEIFPYLIFSRNIATGTATLICTVVLKNLGIDVLTDCNNNIRAPQPLLVVMMLPCNFVQLDLPCKDNRDIEVKMRSTG